VRLQALAYRHQQLAYMRERRAHGIATRSLLAFSQHPLLCGLLGLSPLLRANLIVQ
jgi:hypothetical protein